MNRTSKYVPTDKMSEMICSDYGLLQVMSRFGLSLGVGEATIEEVCRANGVDCYTFLAVTNYMLQGEGYSPDRWEAISLPTLMDYLRRSHHYFLDFKLPAIRGKLIQYLETAADSEVAALIVNFFDTYVKEVFSHMTLEDGEVFTYVERLLRGECTDGYGIDVFACGHGQTDQKLRELKNIIIKYLPTTADNYLTNSLLFDLFSCVEELDKHGHVEDFIFVPAVRRREREMQKKI